MEGSRQLLSTAASGIAAACAASLRRRVTLPRYRPGGSMMELRHFAAWEQPQFYSEEVR